MFRYHFNIQTGEWVIQFLRASLFWVPIKDQSFKTIVDAEKYARERGLDKVYRLQRYPMHDFESGEGAQPRLSQVR